MNTPKPIFRDLKAVTAAVKEVTKENNIPSLHFPDGKTPVTTAVPEVGAKETTKRVRKVSPAKMVRCAVDLPDYLLKVIAKEHVEKGVTKRFLFLNAFRAAGYTIQDADMQEDGRRETHA